MATNGKVGAIINDEDDINENAVHKDVIKQIPIVKDISMCELNAKAILFTYNNIICQQC